MTKPWLRYGGLTAPCAIVQRGEQHSNEWRSCGSRLDGLSGGQVLLCACVAGGDGCSQRQSLCEALDNCTGLEGAVSGGFDDELIPSQRFTLVPG